MADATLKMILLGQDRGASKAIKHVGDESERTQTKSSKMGSAFSKSGKVAGKVLAGGLLLAGAAAVKAGKAAADDEAAQSKLAQTLRTGAHATDGQIASTEKWITAQGKALGVADDDLRPALGKLAIATGDVGKAQKLASLGMDIAAGSGKDLGAVTQALAKAQSTGSVTALAKYGVATKDASGKVKTLSAITKELAEKYQGAAAKAADTTAGKQKKLTLQMGELQEQIGAKLLPVMAKLATAGLAVVEWISNNTKLAGTLVVVIGGLVTAVWAINAAVRAWTAVQMAFNVVMAMNPIGLVVLALAALAVGLVYALHHSKQFTKAMETGLLAIGDAATGLWHKVLKPVFSFIVRAWLNTAGWIINGAARAFGWVPGLGGKLKKAAAWFNDFKQDVNNRLNGIHDRKVKITADASSAYKTGHAFANYLHNLTRPRNVNIHVGTSGGIGGLLGQTTHRAVGGWAPGGVMRVGERGEETVFASRGAYVATADQMRRASSTSGDFTATQPIVLQLDGKKVWHTLLEVKRRNGNISMGLA